MYSTTTILLAALVAAPLALANPYQPVVDFAGQQHTARANGSLLELRDCANPCGWHNQYCCGASETCVTNAGNIADCVTGGGGGNYAYFTTTYVEQGPVTITSTGSYLQTPVQTPAAGSPIACPGGGSCGSVCCQSNQYCQQPGLCANLGASQSAPLRPTSNAVATATASGAQTTIVPSGGASMPTGVASSQPSNQGLSPGAIAGIVIGVLLGVFLLFLILACLCCKGIIDGLLAILGCRRKSRRVEETTIIESRHSHHSHHGSGSRPPQRTWYGFKRPGRTTEVVEERKKTSGMGGFLGVGAFLATLAVLLGLKRRRDRQKSEKDDASYGSVSYYSYEDDYTTSASSASSDRRTRSHRGSARGSHGRGSRR